MSNMMLTNHAANINMISNIGGGGYQYEIVTHGHRSSRSRRSRYFNRFKT